jgi:hypothetical protein
MNRLLEALKEPSTWRGILSILTAAGVAIDPDQASAIIAIGMALIGAINIFRKEPKNEVSNIDKPIIP